MPDYQHLRVSTTPDGVRTITLDRADKLNAVNAALAASLSDALHEAGRDDAARVVVITGAGRAFCAGLDISAPPEIPSATRAERLDPYAWVGRWVNGVVECEKPVIAAVNGAAAGAGFGLALACDLRVVAASAKMTAGYVRRGLSPDAGVSYFLPRHVGLGRAADILLTGRDVDAAEAERIGLATTVIADADFIAGAPPMRRDWQPARPLPTRSRSAFSSAPSINRSTPRSAKSWCTSRAASLPLTSRRR
jgi:Enoyl-CoA hydratase/carnithine racemase